MRFQTVIVLPADDAHWLAWLDQPNMNPTCVVSRKQKIERIQEFDYGHFVTVTNNFVDEFHFFIFPNSYFAVSTTRGNES